MNIILFIKIICVYNFVVSNHQNALNAVPSTKTST